MTVVAAVFALLVIGFSVNLLSERGQAEESQQSQRLLPEDMPKEWPETLRILRSNLPDDRTRLEMIVQLVRKESPEAGLQRLDEYSMYVWSVAYDSELLGTPPFPLRPLLDQEEIVYILANRRFVHLVEVLEHLPKDRAASLVGGELGRALAQYTELWQEEMKDVEFLKKPEYRRPGSHTRAFTIARDDGKPTIMTLRLKILALLMLAGDLRLEQSHAAVAATVSLALHQRKEFYQNPAYKEHSGAHMLNEMSIYHRPALATALLGTAVSSEKQLEILRKSDAQLKAVSLREHINMTTFRGDCVGILLPSEKLEVEHVGLISDGQFDRIVEEVKKAQTQSTSGSP